MEINTDSNRPIVKCSPWIGRFELSKGIPVDVAGMLAVSSNSSQSGHVGGSGISEDLGDASIPIHKSPSPILKADTVTGIATANANELPAGWPRISPGLMP